MEDFRVASIRPSPVEEAIVTFTFTTLTVKVTMTMASSAGLSRLLSRLSPGQPKTPLPRLRLKCLFFFYSFIMETADDKKAITKIKNVKLAEGQMVKAEKRLPINLKQIMVKMEILKPELKD